MTSLINSEAYQLTNQLSTNIMKFTLLMIIGFLINQYLHLYSNYGQKNGIKIR